MSPEISERSFEEAIECALLQHGPDACAGDATVVRETPPPYGDTPPGGYRRRDPSDYDRALCLLPRGVVVLLGWSAVIWLVEVAKYWIIMQGFDFQASFTVLALTMAIANLGTAIPTAPGYIGSFEFLTAQVLLLFGVGMEMGLSYAIVLHAALYFPVTLLGFYFAWSEGLSLRAAEARLEAER